MARLAKPGMNMFGSTLRAYRLGYGTSDRLQAHVRMSETRDGSINITLVPLYQKAPDTRKKELHFIWWDKNDGGGDSIFDTIPSLRHVRKIKRVISFDVDKETGERITH